MDTFGQIRLWTRIESSPVSVNNRSLLTKTFFDGKMFINGRNVISNYFLNLKSR